MQRAADALVGTLREFINQPDYPTLVLGGTDSAIGASQPDALQRSPKKTRITTTSSSRIRAPSAPAYMDAIAQSLVTQREALNAGSWRAAGAAAAAVPAGGGRQPHAAGQAPASRRRVVRTAPASVRTTSSGA